jgi:hypothetical protein
VVFGVAVYSGWRDVFRKRRPATSKLVLSSAFVALWMLGFLQLYLREVLVHRELRQLRPEQGGSLEIGGDLITDSNSISAIVQELNQAKWFELNHGGWGEEVRFVVHLKSNEHRTFYVARYLRQPGAVLISMSGYDSNGSGMSWSNGVVFCPGLPALLSNSGISLPGAKPSPAPLPQETPSAYWSAKLFPLAVFGFFALVSLTAVWGITFGDMGVGPRVHVGGFPSRPKIVGKLVGLPIASMIAAGSSLRVLYTLFDWPDPTNTELIVAAWFALLIGGIGVVALRFHRHSAAK